MSENKTSREIHYNSPEAAKLTTVEGWLAADGTFWPSSRHDAEHMARYSGCTHQDCQDCGAIIQSRSVVCEECHPKRQRARFDGFKREPWDGQRFIANFDGDEYFADIEELAEHCAEHGIDVTQMMLVHCKGNYPSQIDPNDRFCDDLPEDGELPCELVQAFDALNKVIHACGPLSWSPRDIAVELSADQVALIANWSSE